MNFRRVAVQIVGNALLGALLWYWLGLKVATGPLVAANAALCLVLLLGWSVVDAYGLGNWRNWPWAIPAVALTPLMGLHFGTAILIPLLWILVLLPTAAAGRIRLLAGPKYLAMSIGFLLLMAIAPAALLGWIPRVEGFTAQAASFGLRAGIAFIIAIGAWASLLQYIGREARTPETQNLRATHAGDQPVNA